MRLPRPGEVLEGKYRLLRTIGVGSAAAVYEAEHEVVGKRAAIKVLRPELARDPAVRESFVAEARAAARIAHAHVVDVYDLGTTPEGLSYMVMELLQGETLLEVLRARGALGPEYACELLLQVLAGLAAAHAQGIVHRDLKPANVMITHPRPDRPHVKVLDFGIAKGVAKGVADDPEFVLGTPMYMAPEQALGREVDEQADLYAAGAILFEMLSGRTPFEGTDGAWVMTRVVRGQRRSLHTLVPNLKREILELVDQAMALEPAARPRSALEFSARLLPHVGPGCLISLTPGTSSLAPIPLVHTVQKGGPPEPLALLHPTPVLGRKA